MNNHDDFQIALERNWYRIPCSYKSAPKAVKDGSLNDIAFYFTKAFGKNGYSIRWRAKVKNIKTVKRTELFPNIKNDPKCENDYYKIEFFPPEEMSSPIISLRPRRILFIQTTNSRFEAARNINDLFIESPLGEDLWKAFKGEGIEAERQYYVETKEKKYVLDFALFCKNRNIDVECDGDAFHSYPEKAKMDNYRNNELEINGWSVLRFTTDDIKRKLNSALDVIKKTINSFEGLEIGLKRTYKYF